MSAAIRRTKDDGAPKPDLASIVLAAQDRLGNAIHVGQLRDDPLSAALEAIGVSLDAQLRLHDANAGQLRALREPLDPAALARLETAAASGAAKRAAELARAHNRRTVLTGLTVAVAGLLVTGVGGYWLGIRAQAAAIASIEVGIAAAFRDGPAAAAGWLRSNARERRQPGSGRVRRIRCENPDGRRACAVGLWIDPPANPLPRTEPMRK